MGKYNTFIEAAKFQLHVPEFDTAKELDALKQLRERMIKGNMIVDSIDFMSQAVKEKKITFEGLKNSVRKLIGFNISRTTQNKNCNNHHVNNTNQITILYIIIQKSQICKKHTKFFFAN